MKSVALSLFLIAGEIASGPAQTTAPAVWPMPSPIPTPPSGIPETAYPLPRLDWFERVRTNIASAHQKPEDIHLVFDGDSITDYWRTKGQAIWTERYAPLGAFDFGISGDKTQHVLYRLAQGQADGLKPKLIVLMIGTNNIFNNSPEEIAAGVRAIVADYQKRCPEAVVLLQAIFPRGEKAEDPLRAKIKTANQLIAPLGDGEKVIYLDFADKFLEPDGKLSPRIMPDFLHPSAEGYEIWARAIQPVIEKYFPQSGKK